MAKPIRVRIGQLSGSCGGAMVTSSPSVRRGCGARGAKSIRDSELHCPPPKTWEVKKVWGVLCEVAVKGDTTNGLPPPPPPATPVMGASSQGQSGVPCERGCQATGCAPRPPGMVSDGPRQVEAIQPPTKWQKWMARMNPLCACRH